MKIRFVAASFILLLLTSSIFAQAAKTTRTRKTSNTVANTQPQQSSNQQAPVKHLTKFNMAVAYRIWADWYKAQQQGAQLPLPTITVTNADEKEIQRMTVIWHKAQLRAYSDAQRQLEQAQAQIQAQRDVQQQPPVEPQQSLSQPQQLPVQPQPASASPLPVNNSMPGFNSQQQGIAGLASAQIANSLKSAGYTNVVAYGNVPNRIYNTGADNTLATPAVPAINNGNSNSKSRPADAAINPAATGASTFYEYDKVGNTSRVTLPNGVVTSYIYDSQNRLTNVKVERAGMVIASYDYTLGPAGNKLSVRELSGRTVNYDYDPTYRLTTETISGSANPNTNGAIAYTHDNVGNRLQRDSLVGAVPVQQFSYDLNDRLTLDNYDAAGNTIASGNRTYQYDIEGHLIDVVDSSSLFRIHMIYDADGNRIQKTAGHVVNLSSLQFTADAITTRYLVDTNNVSGMPQVLAEIQNGHNVKVYTYGVTGLISQRQLVNGSWVTSYYIHDGLGAVRMLLDANGNITDTYDYDAYGILINQTGNTPNNYLYRGEQFDPDLGFYYLRARFLNTDTGRFITQDPFEGIKEDPLSLHRYLYANANPINRFDRSGRNTMADVSGDLSALITSATSSTFLLPSSRGAVSSSNIVLPTKFNPGPLWANRNVTNDQRNLIISVVDQLTGNITCKSWFKTTLNNTFQARSYGMFPENSILHDDLILLFYLSGISFYKNGTDFDQFQALPRPSLIDGLAIGQFSTSMMQTLGRNSNVPQIIIARDYFQNPQVTPTSTDIAKAIGTDLMHEMFHVAGMHRGSDPRFSDYTFGIIPAFIGSNDLAPEIRDSDIESNCSNSLK